MSLTKIAICMGSQSDWPTMKEGVAILDSLDLTCDIRIISAHRTPDRLATFARNAADEGFEVISQLAGGNLSDQLRTQRLKKRKLALKDEITRLHGKLLPDIIA